MLTLINILVVRRLTLWGIMIDVGLLYPDDSGWRINCMWKFDCFHQHPTLPRTIPLGLWDPLLTAILRWSYLHFPSWSTALLTWVPCCTYGILCVCPCCSWECRVPAVHSHHSQLPSSSSWRCSHSDIWGRVGDSLCHQFNLLNSLA